MSSVDKAYQTQLNNIQTKTGKTMEELTALIIQSGLTKHGEIREMLMRELGLGHGDANSLVHFALKSDGERAAEAKGATTDDVLNEIYNGPKAHMRPIHDALMAEINQLGEFEVAPKKGYVSLRRKRQFAMLGPASNTRFELGLNMKGVTPTERLTEAPAGGMCNYKVKVSAPSEVDPELIAWIKRAYDSAA